ncbi:MAG: hypothetical protein WCA46_04665 [Actinocatenispora sp.]
MSTGGAFARADDPRGRDDGLGWVSRALFADERVRLSLSTRPDAVSGWRAVGRFAVLPDVSRARFLLPLGSPRITAASVLSYNALRGRGTRFARSVLGGLARAGVAELPVRRVLTVHVPSDVDSRELFVVHHLTDALGTGPLQAAIGVRPPDPHHKPTVQLFDRDGRPRGYAKVGWNGATRTLVRAEMAALAALPHTEHGDYPLVPRLRHGGEWAGRTIAVIAPLPAGVRRVPRPQWPYPSAMLAVARRNGPPAAGRPLAGSGYLTGLTDRAEGAVAAGCGAAARAVRAVRALDRRYGSTTVEFGAWHGDWVPWNLGTHEGRLVAWDWEHSTSDVPVGFDLAHHAFQRALTLDGRPAAGATRAAADALGQHGAALGLGREQQGLVLDAYLVELWLRTWTLAAGGAGWNAHLHPALLNVLDTRLR